MSKMSNPDVAAAKLKLKELELIFVKELLRQEKNYEAGAFSAFVLMIDQDRGAELFKVLTEMAGFGPLFEQLRQQLGDVDVPNANDLLQ